RRRAALLFALEQAVDEGHTCLELEALRARTQELFGHQISPETIETDVTALDLTRELVRVQDLRPGATLVYSPALSTCESELASNLTLLAKSGPARRLAAERAVDRAAHAARLELHPDQRAAVLGCL